MRLVIECIDRVGIAQELLKLLAEQNINLEAIELEKIAEKGKIYLRCESLSINSETAIISKINKIENVISVTRIPHLPQERKNLELQALLASLPNPILSLDIQGNITFANEKACQFLLPIYRQNKSKKQQEQIRSLNNVALNQVISHLNRTKWYAAYLEQGKNLQAQSQQPISQAIQIDGVIWRMDLLPLAYLENEQNQTVGYVVSLQNHQGMQLDLRQFMANQHSEFDHIIAKCDKMLGVVAQAKKFALLNAPLLIQGETGTGKDLFAKACHLFSQRRDEKFIAVNCAGLPAEEAESEMFGHRGNGKESIGFFEYANGGTVLLDGISELSLEMQAKLLRFLNDGTFRRVGEDREIRVDVRVICTSQKPLHQLVAEGKLREDLFHRLNVLSLNLPPLRERKDDLPLLAEHFIQQISHQLGIQAPECGDYFLQTLQDHHWTGNLRELYNALYRACSLADGRLNVADLDLPDDLPSDFNLADLEEQSLDELVGKFESALLRKFYNEYPSTRKLAQRLGLSHTAVANKLRLYGIGK